MLSKKKLYKKVKIIAEIGVNHNGKISIAKKLIKIAKNCGADYAKFQLYNASDLVTEKAKKAKYQTDNLGSKISQIEMLKKYQLSITEMKKLFKFCKKIGIKFVVSVFDEKSLNELKNFKVDFIKLPSSEITNYFLLKKLGGLSKIPVIFSTGMAKNLEIRKAYQILRSKVKLIIPMYCVSSYPTSISEIKINNILNLKKKYKYVGLSDHSLSSEAAILSVCYGAKVIEKHLTYDNEAKGPDHLASLNPLKFKEFVNSIRNTEQLLSKNKKYNRLELQNSKFVRKFLVAKEEIKKGDRFTEKNLTCKRSGGGISPFLFNKLKNKFSKRNYIKDQVIKI